MADRIRDLEQLHYVYTQDERCVGKEEMFQRYYSKAPNPPSQPSDGYVKAEIQVKTSHLRNIIQRRNTNYNRGDMNTYGIVGNTKLYRYTTILFKLILYFNPAGQKYSLATNVFPNFDRLRLFNFSRPRL